MHVIKLYGLFVLDIQVLLVSQVFIRLLSLIQLICCMIYGHLEFVILHLVSTNVFFIIVFDVLIFVSHLTQDSMQVVYFTLCCCLWHEWSTSVRKYGVCSVHSCLSILSI